ncbi:hypothetical protein F5887DRAFT_217279 [Amanita rubescens]|nr:hypothetical protein F5887DRAFT_217279 [Amanita rubescens]
MSFDSKSFEMTDLSRHSRRRREFICPVKSCGKTFTQSSGLKAHQNVHTKLKPYVCGIGDCKSAFGDPSSKARHVKEIHRTTHVNVCPVMGCTTRIKRRSAFHAHLRRKHDITDVETVKVSRQPLDSWIRTSKSTPRIPNPPPDPMPTPILTWPLLSPQAVLCGDYELAYSRPWPQNDVPLETIDPRLLQRDMYESSHFLRPDGGVEPGYWMSVGYYY